METREKAFILPGAPGYEGHMPRENLFFVFFLLRSQRILSGSKLFKSTFRVKKGGKFKKNGKNVTFFDFFLKNDLKSCKFRCIL